MWIADLGWDFKKSEAGPKRVTLANELPIITGVLCALSTLQTRS